MRVQSPSRLLKEVLGLVALAAGLLLHAVAQAQPQAQAQAPTPAPASAPRQRLALVLGVGTVGGKPVLDSARRDSEAVAAALKAGGYQVLLREDVGGNDLRAALKEFRDKLRADGAGLIYYTGLAAQVDGRNLLVPADLNLSEAQTPPVVATVLRAVGVPLQELVDALAGGPDSARMLLVDAAYRHPALARLSPPGLTRQRLPPGLIALLGHAPAALQDPPRVEPLAAPLKDARDGAASRFARVVVDALTTPRISAPEALRAVRLAVQDSSGGRVQPWLSGDTSARDHLADAALLETYTPERAPHVTDIIKISMFLGSIICMPDPAEAQKRDAMFLGGNAPRPAPFPILTDGLLERDATGTVIAPAGELSCAGTVRLDGKTGRYDSLVPPGGFTLVLQDGTPLSDTARDLCARHGITCVTIADRRSASATQIGDTQGQFGRFMTAHGIAAMLVRPDFYLFGGAADSARIDQMLANFSKQSAALAMAYPPKPA